ncbi:hypothetical protein [Neobacillus sp. PS2-9]|uniref:hypothetical protein n=1 Tax=Neobacillus sp. PS2-9 TaxID=3070676 RepID=UPI0027E20C4F|nr:hypothetical protein [Neobacillus sp. PS2-9]WML56485.1 hypothetical protein RCG25_16290 [Neobacillus sp. PS2-9]
MKKTLKAITVVAGLTLFSAPVASFAATSGSTAVHYQNQWVKKGSYWTYYNSKGVLQKGWLLLKNKWYFFDTNGYMKTGWASISSKWYYFDASGVMKTGWAKISNQWYFFEGSGAMKTGWLKSGQDWYYLSANGAMKTGWLQLSGKWYFLDRSSGKMALGWKEIDGKTYHFYSNGCMATDTTIDGKHVGTDGAVDIDQTDLIFKLIDGYARDLGLSVGYDEDIEAYAFTNNNGEYVGAFSFDGSVYGDPSYLELWKRVAIELGVPATEAELNTLVEQAKIDKIVFIDDIFIQYDEESFSIFWNLEE